MSNTPFTYSVTTLNQTIATSLKANALLQSFYCIGEISNLTKHRSGHWYLSLKDESSVIKAVMFKMANYKVNFNVNNGDQVLVVGSVDYYGPSGNLQIIIHSMQPIGQGLLLAKLEKLKQIYFAKGYFDESIKKPLPVYPMSIGLIVGDKSAAQADCHTTLQSRWPLAKVIEINPLVQGEYAASQIAAAIASLDHKVDVIVVARGGGSIEDLWAFNEVDVIEAVYNATTPIISGIGHESDTTLIDYVADYRANTPTGAIVAATPNIDEVQNYLANYSHQLKTIISRKLEMHRNKIELMQQTLSPSYLMNQLNYHQMHLDQLKDQLKSFYLKQEKYRFTVNQLKYQLNQSMDLKIIQTKESLKHLIDQLNALSPLNTLSKGYSLTSVNNQLIKSISQVNPKDIITTKIKDGLIESQIINIYAKETKS